MTPPSTPPSYTETQKTTTTTTTTAATTNHDVENRAPAPEERPVSAMNPYPTLQYNMAMASTHMTPPMKTLYLVWASCIFIPPMVCTGLLVNDGTSFCGNESSLALVSAIIGGFASFLLNFMLQDHVEWEVMIEHHVFRAWVKQMCSIVIGYASGLVYIAIYTGVERECRK